MAQELTKQQKEDFQFFVEHRPELFEKYGECVLVIANREVLGSYKQYPVAVRETLKEHDFGTFIVQRCSADESCYIATLGGYL